MYFVKTFPTVEEALNFVKTHDRTNYDFKNLGKKVVVDVPKRGRKRFLSRNEEFLRAIGMEIK